MVREILPTMEPLSDVLLISKESFDRLRIRTDSALLQAATQEAPRVEQVPNLSRATFDERVTCN